MPTPPRRTALVAIAVVLVLLGVGVATYLMGPGGPPEAEDGLTAQASLADPTALSFQPESVLTVRLEGPLETVFTGEGGLYVVDHPQWHVGARVRWFAGDGTALGEYLAPGGSTLFGPDGAGFHYVVAKLGGPSETAVVVAGDGSAETSYTVPLGLNSGALVRFGDTLYARAQSSTFDQETQRVGFTDVLVPVAEGGFPVPESEADPIEAYTIGVDGVAYGRIRSSEPGGGRESVRQFVTRASDGARLEVPSLAVIVGADAQGRVVFVLGPRVLAGAQAPLPGWVTPVEPFAKVYVVGMDGVTEAAAILPADTRPYPARTLALTDEGFTFARQEGDIVTLWSYRWSR